MEPWTCLAVVACPAAWGEAQTLERTAPQAAQIDGEQGPMLGSGMQAPLRASYNILNQDDITAENSLAARKLRQNMDSSSKPGGLTATSLATLDITIPTGYKLHYTIRHD